MVQPTIFVHTDTFVIVLSLECFGWMLENRLSTPTHGGTGAPGILTKDDGYIVRGYGLYAAYAANQHLEYPGKGVGDQKDNLT